MADYYVFFRTWLHFTDQFPVDDFNRLPDKEIYEAIKSHALNWLRENKAGVKNHLRAKKRKLKEAIEARRRQFGKSPRTTSIHRSPPLSVSHSWIRYGEAEQTISLAASRASLAGPIQVCQRSVSCLRHGCWWSTAATATPPRAYLR